jgi:hypothetical protein
MGYRQNAFHAISKTWIHFPPFFWLFYSGMILNYKPKKIYISNRDINCLQNKPLIFFGTPDNTRNILTWYR